MTFLGLKQGLDLEYPAAHPHQDFPEAPPPPSRAWSGTQDLRKGARYVYRINSCQQSILHLPYFKFVNSPALAFYKCLSVIIFQSFEETLIYSLVISFVKYYKLSFLRCR